MLLLLTIIPVLAWGLQDVFIKVSANMKDSFYLKIPACYSIMGGFILIVGRIFSESECGIITLVTENKPVVLAYFVYLLATFISYFGAKFMEISIFSPLENVDGPMTLIMFIAYCMITGKTDKLGEYISFTNVVGILLSFAGVIGLAVLQNRYSKEENKELLVTGNRNEKKKYGAVALLFPLSFCMIDGLSTFIDGLALGAAGEQSIGAVDYLRIIGFCGLVLGIIAWAIVSFKSKKIYIPFGKTSASFFGIALCELIATLAYAFAMETDFILSLIAFNSYSIVTIIISRIFLKEKLTKWQYISVGVVLCGVIMVALSEITG